MTELVPEVDELKARLDLLELGKPEAEAATTPAPTQPAEEKASAPGGPP
jgi:hypothetical protein